MQAFEWTKLIMEGVRPWGNPFGAAQFGSSFFMITGFHGLHVSAGVIYLLVVAFRVKTGFYERRGGNYEIVEIPACTGTSSISFGSSSSRFSISGKSLQESSVWRKRGNNIQSRSTCGSGYCCFVVSFFSYMVDYLKFEGTLRWALILTFMFREGRLYRRHLHAHEVGASRVEARYSGPTRRDYGIDLVNVL